MRFEEDSRDEQEDENKQKREREREQRCFLLHPRPLFSLMLFDHPNQLFHFDKRVGKAKEKKRPGTASRCSKTILLRGPAISLLNTRCRAFSAFYTQKGGAGETRFEITRAAQFNLHSHRERERGLSVGDDLPPELSSYWCSSSRACCAWNSRRDLSIISA